MRSWHSHNKIIFPSTEDNNRAYNSDDDTSLKDRWVSSLPNEVFPKLTDQP